MRKASLILFLALSASAFAEPAHILYHTGKAACYPVRHPEKTGESILEAGHDRVLMKKMGSLFLVYTCFLLWLVPR